MSTRLEKLRRLLVDGPPLLVTNPVNVAYLSGFSGTFAHLLADDKNAWLLTDFRYLEQAREQALGFEVVDIGSSVWQQVGKLLQGSALAFEADHLIFDTYKKMGEALPGVELIPVASPAGRLRSIKEPEEIAAIEAAIRLGDEAFNHILGYIKPGVEERALALELEYFMRHRGARAVSFEIIVASGRRAALPHGVASEKKIERGDAVVLDLGCVLDHYCSDLSRTVFVGEAGEEERRVYRSVLEAQQRALSGLKAGLSCREGDALAREKLADDGLDRYFGHGLGHGLGREVHEQPRLSPASPEALEAGMVVTVEPGVYLPGRFGVRIEDVVVIGEGGCRNLTSSTKELICL